MVNATFNWSLILIPLILVLGGLMALLITLSVARASGGGDVDWQLARIDRKLDLILTHLGIGHDEHVPESVVALARQGRREDAVKEYQRLTGARAAVARREVDYILTRKADAKPSIEDEL